jgi:hypothetical protein
LSLVEEKHQADVGHDQYGKHDSQLSSVRGEECRDGRTKYGCLSRKPEWVIEPRPRLGRYEKSPDDCSYQR